jgi:hypothetical protein
MARGRHVTRRPGFRIVTIVALAIALVAAGRLLTLPEPPTSSKAGASGEVTLRDLWPKAKIVETSGRLADDRAYTPWFHLDAETSVGTALTADGAYTRLVVRGPGAAVRELQRLRAADNPQFNGFVAAGDELFWMVSSGDGSGVSTLYRADWRRGTAAAQLATDTGDVVYFNSQYDLVVADGRVHWASALRDQPVTELRSVPVGGGPVTVQRVDGAFAQSAWPWLTSSGSSQSGPVELRNRQTGQRVNVPGETSELVTCGPVWCRVLLLGAGSQPARTDLMHPDGSARIRVAGGGITSAVLDVALVDRFEVLSQTRGTGETTSLKLILYDIRKNRSVVLADGVATVQGRGPVVWWSTGSAEAVAWFALDLRTLT